MAVATRVRPANGKSHTTQDLRAFAVRFRQKRPDVSLYVTALPLKDLLGRIESDTYRPDNRAGYQRPVAKSRVRQLSEYLQSEEGVLPTSVLICLRQPHKAQFEVAIQGGEGEGGGETGLLTIPADVSLWVVDGQHRLAGLERALVKDKAKWVAEYPLPVVIVEGIDRYEEMRYFHVINTRHKGVQTDVVDRHLLTMREAEGPALLEREGERSYLRARATLLTDLLNNDPSSPWKGLIRMPGEALEPGHMMRQHAMVSSLNPVVSDSFVKQLSDDELGKVLLNYWNAAKLHWQSAFEAPQEYMLQRPLGAGALHLILPNVLEHCRAADDYSVDKMYDVLSYVGRSAGFWHSVRGHHMVRQSGTRYIKALAEYLRERLPRPVLRKL
jgi:DGQHR domain-containing protein